MPERTGTELLINLSAIATNYRLLRRCVLPAECSAVVKADAYGMGIDEVGPVLWAEGCKWFFVSQLDEAIRLRGILPNAEIAVLNGLIPKAERVYNSNRLTPVINYLEELELWQNYAHTFSRKMPAILNLDTGIHRLGFATEELQKLTENKSLLDGIDVRFVMTSLSCANVKDAPKNAEQVSIFRNNIAKLTSVFGKRFLGSIANSSGIFLGPEYHLDLVRPGSALFGTNPTPNFDNPMQNVINFGARILQIKDVRAGESIGYNALYTCEKNAKIAILALGFADGVFRSLLSRGYVYIGDFKAKLVGSIAMDIITIDITDIPESIAHTGAMVEVIGPHVSVDEFSSGAGTIAHEILVSIGLKHNRVYVA